MENSKFENMKIYLDNLIKIGKFENIKIYLESLKWYNENSYCFRKFRRTNRTECF